MKIQNKKNCFTLIELIVSLGVFSILLLVSSIIFSTAQEAWTKSSEAKMIFENVRVFMDMVTSDLQSITSFHEDTPTEFIYNSEDESIEFVSETLWPQSEDSTKIYRVKYYLPANNSGWITRETAPFPDTNFTSKEVIPYVIDLTFNPVYPPNQSSNNIIPYYVEVTLRIIDKSAWERWSTLSGGDADNFRLKHERTFKKNILIGNRGQF